MSGQTNNYIEVVDQLEALTRTILDAVECESTGSVCDLLNARAAACADLARLIESGLCLDGPDLRRILALQAECEEAIRLAIDDTSRRIRELAEERKVRSAYSGRSDSALPRFMDRRQ